MNFEGAKSIILTVLVAASALLTWNIWTYQPYMKKLNQSDFIRVDNDKQEIADVIKPDRVLFHKDGKHFQTNDQNELEKIQTELGNWTLSNVRDASHILEKKKFTSVVHADGNTEVIFPDNIPLDLYKSILNFNDKPLPKVSFDRMVFKTDPGRNEAKVYFINYKLKKVFQAQINATQLKSFHDAFTLRAEEFPEYISKEVNSSRELFIPREPVQLSKIKYYIDPLDINKNFKNTLFYKPESVKQETVTRGREYTDGSRLLSVFEDYSTLEYVNPAQRSDITGTSLNLLQKSIDFVSNHGGWEVSDKEYKIGFRYAALSVDEQKVVFRLSKDGYPVFNEQGMSEIEQTWGNEEIYRYKRPYFTIDFPIEPETQYKISLPAGEQVMKQLTENRSFELADLDDIRVGYKLSRDPLEPELVILEPSWYYLYGGTWTALPLIKPGGGKVGLE